MVKIVTDSTADIPVEMADRLGIAVVPTYIIFDRDTYRDGIDMTKDQFYARLQVSRTVPSTAAASIGAYEEVYQRLAEETDEIVSIQVVARLSAIHSVATKAAENVASATGARIQVIDSGQLSMGSGWMAIAAAEAARRGRSLDEVVAIVESMKPRTHTMAVLDTLEFVHRGGRVNWAQALIGTLLRVKPMIDVALGDIKLLERARTMDRAMERLVARITALGPLEHAIVLHTNAPALAQQLMARVRVIQPDWKPIATPAGVTIASHAGPGAVGIACVTAK